MDTSIARLLALAVTLAVAVALGLWWRARQGRVTALTDGDALAPLDLTQLALPLGEQGTLLQFSSTACAPCRATSKLLAGFVADADGLAHIEVDAEQHLPLVRQLSVMRTPTVFVLDRDGRPVHRVSGVPELPALRAAVATVTDAQVA